MENTPVGTDANFQKIPFSDVLGAPHQAVTLAQIETPDGAVIAWDFGITGGDVTIDRTAQFRRSCKLDLVPYSGSGVVGDENGLTASQVQELRDSLIPDRPNSAMTPYGNLVHIWRGLHVPGYFNSFFGDDRYIWSLGVFRIAEADVSDDGIPSLTITGYDRSRTISRNALSQPWIVTAGTNWGDAILALAQDRDPTAPVGAHSITDTVPAQVVVDAGSDPWQTITDWATAIGQEAFFDADGVLTIQPEPDPTSDPVVWVYSDAEGDGNATITSVSKTLSDDPGYNGVVLTSESATLAVPLRSEAWDLNPSSPTYSLGAYGQVPKFVTNPWVSTQAQADAASNAELLRSIGATEKIQLAAVPNPAHEAGDTIRVVRPLAKVDSIALVDSIVMPLDPDTAMTIACRERRALS